MFSNLFCKPLKHQVLHILLPHLQMNPICAKLDVVISEYIYVCMNYSKEKEEDEKSLVKF